VRSAALAPDKTQKPEVLKGVYARLVDVGAGLAARGMFAAVRADGSSCVLALEEAGIKEVWDFKGSVSGSSTGDLHGGGLMEM
jgi:hypothetical protein